MLTLHNKDFTTKYGTINTTIEAFVEEERNGLFELSFVMLNTDSLFNYIKEDNIILANANNTLLNQKFRIYMTRKLMNNRVEVFARHISFDLMYDYIDNISFENQSCEYALNSLFRGSQFSKHYKGYSNIVNAQNYSISMANVLEAIGGKEGSIIDTFGTGAELLRDNENIHVLNKRGYDNSVSIEYKKNLTGFELEEDTTDLVTRILPYAKYTPEGGEEVIVKASFVDSPLIANYSHPFVKPIDYTDKFEEGEEVTTSKLITFAQNEYKVNKVDMPKQNFKIEFIPLSKCLGYEPFKDSISLCDTVTIKDTRYNINTQAKVIKTTFNVLKNRYEAIELGEPKTSLGDIVGNNDSTKGEKGDKGDKGDKGEDGNIGDFPNSLPSTPIVTAKVYGFANIEISWTFENKVYYQYEVYASKEANFTPNTFNLIHSGQTSTYMFQAKPNETWHFKVCAINTHEKRTNFGYAYATTTKVDDLSNYVEEMAIDNALIGTLSLDRGWVGTLKGNYIDARQLSVTDGNGKRTLDIDSFGNVNLDVNSLKVRNDSVVSKSEFEQTSKEIKMAITSSNYNLILNSNAINGSSKHWRTIGGAGYIITHPTDEWIGIEQTLLGETYLASDRFKLEPNTTYTISGKYYTNNCRMDIYVLCSNSIDENNNTNSSYDTEHYIIQNTNTNGSWSEFVYTFTTTETCRSGFLRIDNNGSASAGQFSQALIHRPMLNKGSFALEWSQARGEIHAGISFVDREGLGVRHENGGQSKLTSKDLAFISSTGHKKMAMYDGGLWMYDWNNDNGDTLGFLQGTKSQTTEDMGVSLTGSQYHSNFVMLGSNSSNYDTDNYSVTPFMQLVLNDFGEGEVTTRIGTHLMTYPFYAWQRMNIQHSLAINHCELMFKTSDDVPHLMYHAQDGSIDALNILGKDALVLGIRSGSKNAGVISIVEETDSNVNKYANVYNQADWNFGGKNITNVYISSPATYDIQASTCSTRNRDIKSVFNRLNIYEDAENSKLTLDVSEILDTSIVDMDKNGNAYVIESELLKLAILEIKQLKEKINKIL